MSSPNAPDLSQELARRIRLVRRDISNLLFHFTRTPTSDRVEVGESVVYPASAHAILRKILHEGRLLGTSGWTPEPGYPCVSFTEAPIQEFNSIFSLNEIAASKDERPRYEPYGI